MSADTGDTIICLTSEKNEKRTRAVPCFPFPTTKKQNTYRRPPADVEGDIPRCDGVEMPMERTIRLNCRRSSMTIWMTIWNFICNSERIIKSTKAGDLKIKLLKQGNAVSEYNCQQP